MQYYGRKTPQTELGTYFQTVCVKNIHKLTVQQEKN